MNLNTWPLPGWCSSHDSAGVAFLIQYPQPPRSVVDPKLFISNPWEKVSIPNESGSTIVLTTFTLSTFNAQVNNKYNKIMKILCSK